MAGGPGGGYIYSYLIFHRSTPRRVVFGVCARLRQSNHIRTNDKDRQKQKNGIALGQSASRKLTTILTLKTVLARSMKPAKPFTLPRGKIDPDEEDHDASAIAFKAPLPKATETSTTTADPSTDFTPNPTSKIGRRQWNDDNADPWEFNAWDNVEWNEEQQKFAEDATMKQAANPVPDEMKVKFNGAPAEFWDTFYATRKDTFFKDRAWLRNEFPTLEKAVKADSGPIRIAELGCGPGNTAFPILAANENPDLFLYALDYSSKAVELVKNNPLYDTTKCLGAVWDMSSSDIPQQIPAHSLDVIIMIFCFSALHPKEWSQTVRNLWKMLKPGAVLLFRDYGRYDLAQLRMKGSRFLEDNLYVRGDGTRVYFFDKDELAEIICQDLSEDDSSKPTIKASQSTETESNSNEIQQAGSKFEVTKLVVDRRLLLNRARKLKMYRIWLQGEFRKPVM
ncbi:hypothetical protein KEM48_000630 [Puccinia striiformis f. sp. tritici PST-130]|uniref:Methyltransferase type 12 domain-containing protein n=1 Tax=Puccinia striiformis f. sp. tritici PST-78 TaxID=1165861 RepID=A0A0L0W5V0_9BASI|nr:hypothetical protein Pst134EB_001861 [Puccinia striiformis f. sp. tritici]KAI9604515.1 hypothetical protein KEM48_000630 [Puccinia striiformis f. sp. tritici PST-130]KNF06861.1 hypothetical protein PSTG_00177 [Puccinia striiformis f. sp. tritici PST-78]